MSTNIGSLVGTLKITDEASPIVGKIQAAFGQIKGILSELGGGFAALGNVADSALSGFATGGPMGAALGAGTAALGEMVKGLQWSVEAAKKSEQAWTDLQASLKLTGPAWDEAKAKIGDFTGALQKSTVYQDEALVGAVQKLSTFGMSYTQAMDAVKIAVDLAAAKHIDLETATGLVGKAFMGNTAIFARYGVDITTAKEASTAMKDAIDTLATALKNDSEGVANLSDVALDAGVKITDAGGKMRSFKDIALELIASMQEGKLSVSEFNSMTQSLGLSLDGSKLKASDYSSIMAQLNSQFGGQATAQAQTYAGAQERLKNAVSDIGEKIGGILLPALAGITEGMIPVASALAQGVDAFSKWSAEIAKTPEMQALMAGLNKTLAGLGDWFGKFAADVGAVFGPALSELWDALKELGSAISPIVEAFGELFAAFGAGQGSGIGLKEVLQLLVLPIKELAAFIKLVAPAVREFADAFKAAADFIAPIIATIRDTITGALGAIKAAFTDFYNFLIGHSLWTDLWNGMVAIVTSIGPAIGAAITGIFDLLKPIIEAGILLIQTTMTTGFQLAFATLQTLVQGATNILTWLIGGVQTIIQNTTTDWQTLVSSITTSIPVLKSAIGEFWKWAAPFWSDQINMIVDVTNASMNTMLTTVTQVTSTLQASWTSMLTSMVSSTRNSFMAIVAEVSAACDAIVARLNAAKAAVSGHSIWPDMLGEMVTQTRDAMGLIQDSFTTGLQSSGGVIPIIQSAQPAMAGAGGTGAPASGAGGNQVYEFHNHIYLDGQLITTQVERRIVTDIQMSASRSRRS